MKKLLSVFMDLILLILMLVACKSSTPAPKRSFTTLDLLIDTDLLGSDWKASSNPESFPAHTFGFLQALEVSEVELKSKYAGVSHIVAQFESGTNAKNSYDDHDYSRDQHMQKPEHGAQVNRSKPHR